MNIDLLGSVAMKLSVGSCYRVLLLCCLSILSVFSFADEPVSTSYFNNVAAGGHDVTAYHKLEQGDEAIKGDKTFEVEWKGATLRFLTKEDSKAFAADPERYTPAYNGHCANALSLGEGLIKTNGKHWAIFEDQLYLFYAPRGTKRWLSGDFKEYKAVSDRAWARILASREK